MCTLHQPAVQHIKLPKPAVHKINFHPHTVHKIKLHQHTVQHSPVFADVELSGADGAVGSLVLTHNSPEDGGTSLDIEVHTSPKDEADQSTFAECQHQGDLPEHAEADNIRREDP